MLSRSPRSSWRRRPRRRSGPGFSGGGGAATTMLLGRARGCSVMARRNSHVRRFKVAMDNQALVRVSNSRADLAEKLEALFRFQLALIAIVIQSLALDVFHDKKWNSIRSKAAAVKLRDVWVIETGEE